MVNFIDAMINKIKDISSFDTIIDLIDVKKIKDKNKYLEALKNVYEDKIKDEIEALNEKKLKDQSKQTEIIAKLVKLIIFNV